MSRENVEIVKRGYDAFNRNDLEAFSAALDPAFQYVSSGAVPGAAGTYEGLDGFARFAQWMRDNFDGPRAEVHELTDAGDRVLASVALRGRGRQSGIEADWKLWHVWTLRDGKVLRGQAFTNRAEARDAAGLAEEGG